MAIIPLVADWGMVQYFYSKERLNMLYKLMGVIFFYYQSVVVLFRLRLFFFFDDFSSLKCILSSILGADGFNPFFYLLDNLFNKLTADDTSFSLSTRSAAQTFHIVFFIGLRTSYFCRVNAAEQRGLLVYVSGLGPIYIG